MRTPSPPPAPDPAATAAAQTRMNRETAITQQGLNMVNQRTPYGALNYTQIGNWQDGTPRYEATQTLTPEQQGLLDQQNQFDRQFNQIALDQTQRIGGVLGQPIDLNNQATESRLMELGRARLDPILQQRRQSLETDLANRGITMGSEAYRNAMTQFGQQENDAYNSLLLGGRQQAVQEALLQRNQPINEITALMGGGQVQLPQFANTPQTGVAPTDYMGAVRDNYAGQMAGYNARMQQQNAMIGGIAGLGGALLGGWARGGFPFPR